MNVLVALTQTVSDSGPITPDDIINRLIPKLWPFLMQLFAFIILFIVVFFLAYKPVKKLLKQRHDFVEKNITDSKKSVSLAEAKLEEANVTLNNSYSEAKNIINDAKNIALKEKENIINEAKIEAKNEVLKAKEEIALEVKRNEEAMKQEMVNVALLASEKILEREVDKKDNTKCLNEFIKDMKKDA